MQPQEVQGETIQPIQQPIQPIQQQYVPQLDLNQNNDAELWKLASFLDAYDGMKQQKKQISQKKYEQLARAREAKAAKKRKLPDEPVESVEQSEKPKVAKLQLKAPVSVQKVIESTSDDQPIQSIVTPSGGSWFQGSGMGSLVKLGLVGASILILKTLAPDSVKVKQLD